MTATPKTIQIFLPGGDPQGIRIAEITTRIVQVIEVPRSLLPDFLKMDESKQVALYFLFGTADDGSDPRIYIGQTGDLPARLLNHNKNKDFWQKALILISRTNSLTQTHSLFLEWYCLQEAARAGRYANENGNAGSKPHTPAPLQADCMEIFDTGRTLLATLGYPIFDAVAKSVSVPEVAAELFYCKAKGVNGRGLYTSEGFVVLKDSLGRSTPSPKMNPNFALLRKKLIETNVIHAANDFVIFNKDHLFNSPSAAAAVLLGRTANGWFDWKSENGVTLHVLKRVAPNDTP